MTPVDILKAARDLISEPSRWTTGSWARDEKGKQAFACESWAVCWCSLGAINRVADGSLDARASIEHLRLAAGNTDPLMIDQDAVVTWNDAEGRTHAEVLAAFDAAIAAAGVPA